MFRSVASSALRSSRRSIFQTTQRSFSSQSTLRTSRWVLPSSLMVLGLATVYMSQPLVLEAKATEPVAETEEASEKPEVQEAAFNAETGEINWDCPCLGGMAHGPCGEDFKEAFSCFVFSEAEPKGIDCVEKFKNMQNCFRRYPEIYSEEIRGDEEPVDDFNKPEDKAAAAEAAVEAPGASVHEVEKAHAVAGVPEINKPEDKAAAAEAAVEAPGASVHEVEKAHAVADVSETK